MGKWEKLMRCLKFYESRSIQSLTEDKIVGFEIQNRIHLPQEYRNFLRVFGAGRFGDFIEIYRPSSHTYHRVSEITLEWAREYIKEYPSKDVVWDRELDDLLSHAFIFGGDDRTNYVLWDLRSYQSSDDSYDIFWLDGVDFIDDGIDYSNDVVYKIGRDFYEFICNFCCGLESYRILPDSRPPQPGEIRYEFTQYVEYVNKRDDIK
ncbi:MAG: SMI1/KNR4 family protein [Cyanobacteria bacterium P01_E01_bin.42]